MIRPMSLQAHELSCRRGDRLLFENLSFQINPGELLLVEGHNGCGKTTLLKTLVSLRQPDSGYVSWQQQAIGQWGDEYRAQLLWLGHLNGIKLDLSAIENLTIACALQGLQVSGQDVMQALDRMGLYGYEELPVRFLSQGQKRRTALAFLVLNQTPLWVLDEPFTALDVKAVDFLQGVIGQHVEQGGMVILTTHQQVDLTSGSINRLRLAA